MVNPDTNNIFSDPTWISATATRNFASSEHLLDWLNLYGESKGFKQDNQYDGYDERTDFSRFVMNKGIEFESAVARHLSEKLEITTILKDGEDRRNPDLVNRTEEAMIEGIPLIYQGILKNPHNKTYGIADFLIRSDFLKTIFPESISDEDSKVSASILGNKGWHYRVIDAKFTTLKFGAKGTLSPSGSNWGYMIQVYIYNQALGYMQGFVPDGGYLLGRRWEQKIKGETYRSNSCVDRLAFIPDDTYARSKGDLSQSVHLACDWVRKVRAEGNSWSVLPEPSIPELRPNMSSDRDQPWHQAKSEINTQLKDLTTLWKVGYGKRLEANDSGIYRWDDKNYTSEDVGIGGEKEAPVLTKIINMNRDHVDEPISPKKLISSDQKWRNEGLLEFFVDFETVSDLDDNFTKIPYAAGQPLIFMVGCGHIEGTEWKWSHFTVDDLTEESEAKILKDWTDHMKTITEQRGQSGVDPLVYHWSPAETSTFETAYNSAKERHTDNNWGNPNWFDFLKNVVRIEPLIIKGSFGFGLKSIATAMYNLGAIQTLWKSGSMDGLGAMVGAWNATKEAKLKNVSLIETDLMNEICKYNEIDCKVMMEIVRYLRSNH